MRMMVIVKATEDSEQGIMVLTCFRPRSRPNEKERAFLLGRAGDCGRH